MRKTFPYLLSCVLCAALAFADVVAPYPPDSLEEQHNVIPPENTDLANVFEQLDSKQAAVNEGALLWLLRREKGEDLGYWSFPAKSIRFGVEHVRKAQVGGIDWRLVECRYLGRNRELISGHEWRANWQVAYLLDGLGRLRDYVDDYDVLFLDDINADGRVELFVYQDSPKRALMYTYDRGRARELLRVDHVPEGAHAIRIVPGAGGEPKQVEVAGHGVYRWDARSERYVPTAASDGR